MFKKAKYRWQIKSSNRSNQLMGLGDDEENNDEYNTDGDDSEIGNENCLSDVSNVEGTSDQQMDLICCKQEEENGAEETQTTQHVDDGTSINDSNNQMQVQDNSDEGDSALIDYAQRFVTNLRSVKDDKVNLCAICPTEPEPEAFCQPDLTVIKAPVKKRQLSSDQNFAEEGSALKKPKIESEASDIKIELRGSLSQSRANESSLKPDISDTVNSKKEQNDDGSISEKFETSVATGFVKTFDQIIDPPREEAHALIPSAQTPRRLTYLERWRCQHLAKAMVDNAINKTLEESGLSPNPQAVPATDGNQQTNLETEGVSHAIRMVGLRPRYSPSSMQRLNPIINRLTQVSENIFSANLRNRNRPTTDNTGQDNGNAASTDGNAHLPNSVGTITSLDTTITSPREPLTFHTNRNRYQGSDAQSSLCDHLGNELPAGSCDQCLNNYPKRYSPAMQPLRFDTPTSYVHNTTSSSSLSDEVQDNDVNHAETPEMRKVSRVDEAGKSQTAKNHSSKVIQCKPDLNSDEICDEQQDEELVTDDKSSNDSHGNLSTSFLLDTAVAFAINEKGLQLN